jgi:hypothetical protein
LKKLFITGIVLVALAISLLCWKWKQDEPRRQSIATLQNLCLAVRSDDNGLLLKAVVFPQALDGRTPAEQTEFLTKALQNEISPEGLAVLKREGRFGSLRALFPKEADHWAELAGVNPEECVAFKAELNGLQAQVVLFKDSTTSDPLSAFRVIRCNNVKQLAANTLP